MEPKRLSAHDEGEQEKNKVENEETAVIASHTKTRLRLGSTGSDEARSTESSEVKSPISGSRSPSPTRNHGKSDFQFDECYRPMKRQSSLCMAPKKRYKLESKMPPFRPWDEDSKDLIESKSQVRIKTHSTEFLSSTSLLTQVMMYYQAMGVPQDEIQRYVASGSHLLPPASSSPTSFMPHPTSLPPEQEEPLSLVVHKQIEPERGSSRPSSVTSLTSPPDPRPKQRNYKNMTRERRIEANARERQRVHTITAAFDALQAAIPSVATDEPDPKLSKLSIIRIASAYIMALSREAGYDYSEDQSEPSVQECIAKCKELMETERKARKKK